MSAIARLGFGRARQPSLDARPEPASKAFTAALRHSRRVRFLRKFIPFACVAIIVAPIAWGLIEPLAKNAPNVTVGAVSISGTRIRMDSPKLSGFKKDQRGYEVTAKDAVQDVRTPGIVELNSVNGRMEQEANSFARVTADWGRFDQAAERLDLKGEVKVRTDKGQEADLKSARIDVKTGDIFSQEPVEIRSKSGTINADAMTIKDNGRHAVFEGRVRSVFVPEEEQAAAPGTGAKTQ